MRSTTGTVRAGFTRHEVANDGLLVYLYDPANTDMILESVPIDNDYPLDEHNLEHAVKSGLIVLIQLTQDDDLNFEVGQGRPVTKKEKANFVWLPTEQAHLSLPSGVLRIDSVNSLALIPEEADEDGAEFVCKPGHYRLSIDRASVNQPGDNEEFDGPTHVITLKSVSRKEFARNDSLLIAAEGWLGPDPKADSSDADTFFDRPAPRGRVNGDRFYGHVYFDKDKTFFLNLSPSSANELKLNFVNDDGSGDFEKYADYALVRVPALGLDINCGINGRRYFDMSRRELVAVGKNVATGLSQQDRIFGGERFEMIRFSWNKNSRKIKATEIEQWYEAILEVS